MADNWLGGDYRNYNQAEIDRLIKEFDGTDEYRNDPTINKIYDQLQLAEEDALQKGQLFTGDAGRGDSYNKEKNALYLFDKKSRGIANSDRFSNQYDYLKGQRPIGINYTNPNQTDAYKDQMIQNLHALAQGDRSVSSAQQQLGANTATATGNVGGLAAARGNYGGAGAAMRAVRQQQAGIGAAGFEAGNALQAQEQAASQAILAQMYASQQGQDINMAKGVAGLSNQGDASRYGSLLGAIGGDLGRENANIQLRGKAQATQYGYDQKADALRSELYGKLSGALGTGIATYGSMNSGDKK